MVGWHVRGVSSEPETEEDPPNPPPPVHVCIRRARYANCVHDQWNRPVPIHLPVSVGTQLLHCVLNTTGTRIRRRRGFWVAHETKAYGRCIRAVHECRSRCTNKPESVRSRRLLADSVGDTCGDPVPGSGVHAGAPVYRSRYTGISSTERTSGFGLLIFDLNSMSSIRNDVECPGDDFRWLSGIFSARNHHSHAFRRMPGETSRLLKSRRVNRPRIYYTETSKRARIMCYLVNPPNHHPRHQRPSLRRLPLAALIAASPSALVRR